MGERTARMRRFSHIVYHCGHNHKPFTPSISNIYDFQSAWRVSMKGMQFETTIGQPVEVSGVGLHTGVPVKLRMVPAPAGTGIVLRRSDLDYFPIPASWKYVERVSYATSLMRQGVLISTTEHLLSTLYSFGIDNLWLEVDKK